MKWANEKLTSRDVLLHDTAVERTLREKKRRNFYIESLTTNLPISPAIVQHHTTKATVLCQSGNSITNAIGPVVSVIASAVVGDAILHQNIVVEHFKAIFHFRILQQVDTNKVRFLFNRRLACYRRDWLRVRNALFFILVQVGSSPRVNKRRCHLTKRNRNFQ